MSLVVRSKLRLGWAGIWLALLVGLAGCGIADALDSLAQIGVDDGASAGETKSAVARPDQETTIELSTGAKLYVPAGAVSKDIELSMARPKDEQALQLVQSLDKDKKVSSAPYVLTPHGTKFEKDVEVTLPIAVDHDKTKKLEVVWLQNESDKEWKALGTPRTSGKDATISVAHFSVLMLVEVEAGGAAVGNAEDAGTRSPASMDGGVGGGLRADSGAGASCNADFRCDTVQEQCGVVFDSCGNPHDLAEECVNLPGCGSTEMCVDGTCTSNYMLSGTVGSVAGSGTACTSYSDNRPDGCYGYLCGTNSNSVYAGLSVDSVCNSPGEALFLCDGAGERRASNCSRDHALDADPAAGTRTCMRGDPALDVFTDNCLECMVQATECARNNCLAECLTGDGPECDTCRESKGCVSGYYACIGLPSPR